MFLTLRIETGSRLHLGFLDLHGGLGRRFGSLGISIDRPRTIVEAGEAACWSYKVPESFRFRVEAVAKSFRGDLPPLEVRLLETARAHVGFGSGTQVALAVGRIVAELLGLDGEPRRLASLLGRGRRSGVGVEAFAAGGFILDGGLRPGQEGPPPLLLRRFPPPEWRFLLAVACDEAGLSGDAEERALERMAPPEPELASGLCRLVLMSLLPALEEEDGPAFGAALTEIQRLVGASFSAVQGGLFASPEAESLLGALSAEGALGVGQSSWGPAVFGFFDDPDRAEAAMGRMKRRLLPRGTELILASALNEGARIERIDPFREEVPDASSRR